MRFGRQMIQEVDAKYDLAQNYMNINFETHREIGYALSRSGKLRKFFLGHFEDDGRPEFINVTPGNGIVIASVNSVSYSKHYSENGGPRVDPTELIGMYSSDPSSDRQTYISDESSCIFEYYIENGYKKFVFSSRADSIHITDAEITMITYIVHDPSYKIGYDRMSDAPYGIISGEFHGQYVSRPLEVPYNWYLGLPNVLLNQGNHYPINRNLIEYQDIVQSPNRNELYRIAHELLRNNGLSGDEYALYSYFGGFQFSNASKILTTEQMKISHVYVLARWLVASSYTVYTHTGEFRKAYPGGVFSRTIRLNMYLGRWCTRDGLAVRSPIPWWYGRQLLRVLPKKLQGVFRNKLRPPEVITSRSFKPYTETIGYIQLKFKEVFDDDEYHPIVTGKHTK